MPNSAFMGQPPANDRDLLIVKGMITFNGGHRDPRKGVPLGPPPHPRLTDSHAGSIIASCVTAMFFVIVITGTRVIAKFRSKRSRLGWDDYLITLAAVSAFIRLTNMPISTQDRLAHHKNSLASAHMLG